MSDYLADTPRLGRGWCPTCEPAADPSREILDTFYCGAHLPLESGVDDAHSTATRTISSPSEADGHDCREIARLIR